MILHRRLNKILKLFLFQFYPPISKSFNLWAYGKTAGSLSGHRVLINMLPSWPPSKISLKEIKLSYHTSFALYLLFILCSSPCYPSIIYRSLPIHESQHMPSSKYIIIQILGFVVCVLFHFLCSNNFNEDSLDMLRYG